MFSLLLLALGAWFVYIYRQDSKPTNCFFEPELAKCDLMDQYMRIQAMPSKHRQQAMAKWQQEFNQFNLQVNKLKKP